MRLIVGIDEVGRGPLAGPVSVGIVVCEERYDISYQFDGLTDSKQMTEKARERVWRHAKEAREEGTLAFGVFSRSAEYIDAQGIERAISDAITCGIQELAPDPQQVQKVYLDGRLKAPREYAQETIIRGDALIPAISLASVVAKVERDSYMKGTLHLQFPEYGFDAHKGYGTTSHIKAIREHGPSAVHRSSFLSRIPG